MSGKKAKEHRKTDEGARPKGDPTREPCGCVKQEMTSGKVVITPCVPHGLLNTAENLAKAAHCIQSAAQVLASTASTILNKQNAATMAHAVSEAAKGKQS